MPKNLSLGVSLESRSSHLSRFMTMLGAGLGGISSSHGMTSSPGRVGKALARNGTLASVSPATAVPPWTRNSLRGMSPVSIACLLCEQDPETRLGSDFGSAIPDRAPISAMVVSALHTGLVQWACEY